MQGREGGAQYPRQDHQDVGCLPPWAYWGMPVYNPKETCQGFPGPKHPLPGSPLRCPGLGPLLITPQVSHQGGTFRLHSDNLGIFLSALWVMMVLLRLDTGWHESLQLSDILIWSLLMRTVSACWRRGSGQFSFTEVLDFLQKAVGMSENSFSVLKISL